MGKYANLSSGKIEMTIKNFHNENYKFSLLAIVAST
jgi:hypothetical protein